MDKPFISVEDLVNFHNSPKFSVYTLIFKPKRKGVFIGLCVLYIMANVLILVSLIESVLNNYYPWKIGIVVGGTINILIIIVLSRLQKHIESKSPDKKTFTQLKSEALRDYCKSKQITKSDLEKIRDILIREETKSNKKFSMIIPGAVVLLPLWNSFLNKLFTYTTDTKSLSSLFVGLSLSMICLSFVMWLTYKLIYDVFIIRRYDKLKATINAIEELLLNQYQ